MSTLKIAVYTIALNELKHVDRWADSVADADYLIVADTGSTDGTVKLLEHRGVQVSSIAVKPWRFDDARNAALSLVPADADVCISMDMDELMAPGWRQALETGWVPGTTRLRYTYVHSFDADGQPLHSFMADKLHSRFGYRWQRPVHETVVATGDETTVVAPDVVMWHKPDTSKSRGQYLPLLAKCHEEFPRCSQTAYWYARELAFNGQGERAAEEFKLYLAMPEAGWADERSEAMKWLGELLPHERLKWLRAAANESPNRRENWLNLAEYYYSTGDWINLYAATKEGLKLTSPSRSYLDYPHAWGGRLWDLGGLGAWNIGLREESLVLFEKAAELEPNDGRIANNLRFVQAALGQQGD